MALSVAVCTEAKGDMRASHGPLPTSVSAPALSHRAGRQRRSRPGRSGAKGRQPRRAWPTTFTAQSGITVTANSCFRAILHNHKRRCPATVRGLRLSWPGAGTLSCSTRLSAGPFWAELAYREQLCQAVRCSAAAVLQPGPSAAGNLHARVRRICHAILSERRRPHPL